MGLDIFLENVRFTMDSYVTGGHWSHWQADLTHISALIDMELQVLDTQDSIYRRALDAWMDDHGCREYCRSHFGSLSFGTWGMQENWSSQRFARCCCWEFDARVGLARDGTRLAYCEKHQYIDGMNMKHHVATVKAVASTALQLLSSPRMPQVRHLP